MKLKKVIFFWLVAVSLFFVGSFVVGASERKMIPITVETAWILCNISFIISLLLIVFTLIKSTKISLKLISVICLGTLLYFSFLSVKAQIALYDNVQLEKPNYAVTATEQNFESHHTSRQKVDEETETDIQEESIDEIISQLNFRDGIPTNSVFTFTYNRTGKKDYQEVKLQDYSYQDEKEFTVDLCENEIIYKSIYRSQYWSSRLDKFQYDTTYRYETYHIVSVENDGNYQITITSNLQSGKKPLYRVHYINLLEKTIQTRLSNKEKLENKGIVYDKIEINSSTCTNQKTLFKANIYHGSLSNLHISQYKMQIMELGKIHLEKITWKVSYNYGVGVKEWIKFEENTKTAEHQYYYFHPSYIQDLKNSTGKGIVKFKCYPDRAFILKNSKIGGGVMTIDFDEKLIKYEAPVGGYKNDDFACKMRNGDWGSWGRMFVDDNLLYTSNPFLEKEYFEKK